MLILTFTTGFYVIFVIVSQPEVIRFPRLFWFFIQQLLSFGIRWRYLQTISPPYHATHEKVGCWSGSCMKWLLSNPVILVSVAYRRVSGEFIWCRNSRPNLPDLQSEVLNKNQLNSGRQNTSTLGKYSDVLLMFTVGNPYTTVLIPLYTVMRWLW